jgi:ABC-2 type transport system permease protein
VIRPITALVLRNLIKLKRDKMKLIMNLFMSGVFLFIFSFVMKSPSIGIERPMNYLISGIIIMTVFQSSITNSMNILEDISSGFMKEILVAPIFRWQIVIGQVLSSAIISVIQGIIIIAVGFFIGLTVNFVNCVGMVCLMLLVGLTFSSLGLYLATISKESGNFQLLITIITFPLTFLSGAYIPTMVIPSVLKPFVYINPLTYTTAAFRFFSLNLSSVSSDVLIEAGVAFNIFGFIITPVYSVLMIFIMLVAFFYMSVNRFSYADFSNIKVFKRERSLS